MVNVATMNGAPGLITAILQIAEKQIFVSQVSKSRREIPFSIIIYQILYFLDDSLIAIIVNHDIESCFNEMKDNGEEGFDCGGPCRRKCVGTINLDFFIILRF